jgi:hypothetical protein
MKVLFDVLSEEPPNVGTPLWIAVLVLVAATLSFCVTRLMGRRMPVGIAIAMTTFALLLIVACRITVWRFNNFVRAYREGRYVVVEGTVDNFMSLNKFGHGKESFDVNGRHFTYSDFIDTPGFHKAAMFGGPIRSGMRVRIYSVGGQIARLETAE